MEELHLEEGKQPETRHKQFERFVKQQNQMIANYDASKKAIINKTSLKGHYLESNSSGRPEEDFVEANAQSTLYPTINMMKGTMASLKKRKKSSRKR